MTLKNPEKSLENTKNMLRCGSRKMIANTQTSGLFYLMRDKNSAVENSLALLEAHFKL